MKFFLDTANIEHIKRAVRLGVIHGVTTNPSLVSKEGEVNYQGLVKDICAVVPGPVSAEVLSTDADGMVSEARKISGWAENIVVKIPATLEGIEATSVLSKENIKVNLTLCFSLNQAMLGAAAGATFISPFVGRLDDIGEDGMQLVAEVVNYLEYYQLPSQVIASSIRHTQHCLLAAKARAHVATVPYKVLLQMVNHPLTDIGVERFLNDWKSIFGNTAIVSK